MTTHTIKKWQVGFTLVELLVVVGIIAILASIGIASFATAGERARDGKRQADIELIRQALVLYRSERGCYPGPTTYDGLTNTLRTAGFLVDPVPEPPRDGDYEYQPQDTCTAIANGRASFVLTATLEDGTEFEVRSP